MKKIYLTALNSLLPIFLIAQNIGVGTTTPGFPLHVVKNAANIELARFQSNGGLGKILVGNGSAFSAFGHTGICGYAGTESSHDFIIRTNSIDRMYFQESSGNVGIGTNSPIMPLHLVSDNAELAFFEGTNSYAQIVVSNGIMETKLGADQSNGFVGTNSNSDFFLRAGGDDIMALKQGSKYVGIGTSLPECKFNVVTDEPNSDVAIFKNTSGNSSVLVAGAQTLGLAAYPGVCQVGSFTPCDLQLNTFGVPRLTIQNSTGNLGIATSNPAYRLQVNSINSEPSTIADFHALGYYGKIQLSTALPLTAVLGADLYTAYVGTDSWNDFALRVAGVNVMTINASSQRIGIGTGSPVSTLHVVSTNNTGEVARFENTYTGSGFIRTGTPTFTMDLGSEGLKSFINVNGNRDLTFNLNNTERMRIKGSTGNIGIGTDAPATKLHVVGNTYLAGTLVVTSDITGQNNMIINGSLSTSGILQDDRIPVTWFNGNFHDLGSPYENVTYYKDKENRVHLSGIVEIVGTQTGTMFILPPGYCPMGNQVFAQMTSSGNVNRINVNSSGNVTIQGNLSGWVSVDGISFRAN